MKRIIFMALVIFSTLLTNTFASTWVTYDTKGFNKEHPDAPVFCFDKDSMMIYEPENNTDPKCIFFWEKVIFPADKAPEMKDIDYCLYLGRVDLDTLNYYSALMACHTTSRGMLFGPKGKWEYRGNTNNPLHLLWIEQILKESKGSSVTLIHETVDLDNITEEQVMNVNN